MTPAARRALGQYFTPDALVDHLLGLAGAAGLPAGARVLEPACGDGAFLVGLVRLLGPRAAALEVTAFDVDAAAARACRRRVAEALATHAGLTRDAARRRAGRWIRMGDFLAAPPAGPFDLALGNPPFLEAKRMPRALKQRLRRDHPAWTRGAFDLFVPFVGRAAEALAPGGRLAFVLPNKVGIAAYARALRALLLEDLALEALTDLSDTRAFEGASVYPVALVARRPAPGRAGGPGRSAHGAVRTHRGHRHDGALTFTPSGTVPRASFTAAPDQVLFVPPASPAARAELEALLDPPARLGDYLDIRWTVSFHRAGLRDRYLFPTRPDSPHARRLLGAGRYAGNTDVARYHLGWRGWWIDYDQARAAADGNHLPDPAIFEAPKLVICQNARRLRAALDREGYVLKDTFFAARPTARCLAEGVPLEALLGLVSSDLLHRWYAAVFGLTRVNGGYLHYLGSYLKHLPVPEAGFLDAGLVEAVRACEAAAARVTGGGGESATGALARAEAKVEARVRAAFHLPVHTP